MSRPRFRAAAGLAGGALLVSGVAALGAAPASAADGDYTVVASGLNNPRHLGFSHGRLLVAESGSGGDGPCIISSEGGQVCYGPTGSITEITQDHGQWQQRRVVTGLPSLAGQVDDPEQGAMKGGGATGPSDVDALWGNHYVVSIGLGAPPSARGKDQATSSPESTTPATLPKGFGTLLLTAADRGSASHPGLAKHQVLADIARHEQKTNPVDGPDSNPAALLRVGGHYVVADAGGNTVVSANFFGRVRTIASFPDQMVQAPGAPTGVLMPMQFVPTAVARYQGDLYVSQLTGFPFPKGGSTIWKLDRAGHPHAYATGLTNVTDLAFAPDGTLYAVEISTEGLASGGPPIGALVRIPSGGGSAQVVAGGLFAPYGVALRGSTAFVTTGSVLPGGGEVIKVPLR
jgi:hypothetical protein